MPLSVALFFITKQSFHNHKPYISRVSKVHILVKEEKFPSVFYSFKNTQSIVSFQLKYTHKCQKKKKENMESLFGCLAFKVTFA